MATSLTTNPLLAPPAVPPPQPPVTHDVTIVTTRKLAQARVLGVPPEEFGIERGARSIPTVIIVFMRSLPRPKVSSSTRVSTPSRSVRSAITPELPKSRRWRATLCKNISAPVAAR